MERSYEKLPREVLGLIFDNLGQDDLAEVQLTCKRWCPIAREFFFRYLDFEDTFIDDILDILTRNPSLAKAVLHLNFESFGMWDYIYSDDDSNGHEDDIDSGNDGNGYEDDSNSIDGAEGSIVEPDNEHIRPSQRYNDVFTFLRLCPNITTIALPFEPPISFCQDLIELLQQGYLRRLEEFVAKDYDNDRDDWINTPSYHNLLSALKNNLKVIDINNHLDPTKEGNLTDSGSSLVFNNISSFPQLQELRLAMQQYSHVHEFDSFLDNCSGNLTRLHIKILQHCKHHSCRVTTPHQIKQVPNVKNLDVQMSATSSSREMWYIMRKFPGLQVLSIRSLSHAARLLRNASSFFQHIGQIPSVYFECGFMLTETDSNHCIPQLLQATRDNSHLTFSNCGYYVERSEDNSRNVKILSLSTSKAKGSDIWSYSETSVSMQLAYPKALLQLISSQRNCIKTIEITVPGLELDNALNGEDFGTIISSFCGLKNLDIEGMKIAHLGDVDLRAKILNLQHLHSFFLSSPSWIKDIPIDDDSYYDDHCKQLSFELQMPFTKVGGLWLDLYYSPVLVRVATASATYYLRYANREIKELTYHDYRRLVNSSSEQVIANLCFATISSVHIGGGSYRFK
ncbi:hypothetical protein MBANPS3_003743 [Mucor bainieri]